MAALQEANQKNNQSKDQSFEQTRKGLLEGTWCKTVTGTKSGVAIYKIEKALDELL